jgi:Cytochrome D1 heme domain
MRTIKPLTVLAAAMVTLVIAGCGDAAREQPRRTSPAAVTSSAASQLPTQRQPTKTVRSPPLALVTAQTRNRLLVVDLTSGRVVRSATISGEPDYVATTPNGPGSVAVVVSSGSGVVTLLDLRSLRPIRVLHGFASPHIPAIFPDGDFAYVTDDGSGKLTVIGLYNDRILSSVNVGVGAHHLAFTPDQREVWVALGQSARTIVILSTIASRPASPSSPVGDPGHPHVVGHFDPGFLAHDLLFTSDGRRVWITSADTRYVGVFSTRARRLLFRVPGGPPPQHLVFDGRYAYVTSGYGSLIEKVRIQDGRVVSRAWAPYGSFDLAAAGRYIVTASLLQGKLAIYNDQLRLLHVRHLAPSTEDVAISRF